LFDNLAETMSEEEYAIAASTEGYRIGAPSAPASAADTAPVVLPEPARQATEFVERTIRDPEQPVVMFALEWCEFCWALRNFFRAYGIACRSVDLDSVPFQQDNLGGEIRRDLHRRLGSPTIPQVFVGGEHVGGCTDTLELFRTCELQARLRACGVAFDAAVTGDPARFLPKRVHPR
jgi:cysteine synthase A